MQAVWFSGNDDKEVIKQELGLAQLAFKRLVPILKAKMKDNTSQDYDKAAWPFYAADNNGYNRALTEVLKLIDN